MKLRPQAISRLVAAIAVLCMAIVLLDPPLRNSFILLLQFRTISQVRSDVDSLGAFGPIIMIGLMVVHSVTFVPSEIIMVTDVVLFGPVWGIVYSWIGSMLGAYLSFFLARWIGRSIVKKFVPERILQRFDGFFEHKGVWGVFVLRLIPLVSFNALNYATGLTKMTLWQFTWSTGLGILPASILFALVYQSVNGQKYAFVGLTIVGILMLVVLVAKAKLSKKYRLNEKERV